MNTIIKILAGTTVLIAAIGCGGSGNDKFELQGSWSGHFYGSSAEPVQIQVLADRSLSGTKNGSPVTGTVGISQVFFSDGDNARYSIVEGRIEGPYIRLERS